MIISILAPDHLSDLDCFPFGAAHLYKIMQSFNYFISLNNLTYSWLCSCARFVPGHNFI